ncbi:hypothetical protein EB815_31925 [Mesorhizobium loti]|nr:hypothetical protein EB815_31925 [Mesorhizobium loti]
MGQILHGSASTTEAVRRAIQDSHVWTAPADRGLFSAMGRSRVRSCLRPVAAALWPLALMVSADPLA